ncbi:MAG: carbamoyltransferase HypF [Bacteroidales bacterium]|nr:carbamoyltransferase HypF [Bacteroidales bacterium]
MGSKTNTIAKRFIIKGRVQGVGFRPYVFRLAYEYRLSGFVYNQTDAIVIKVQGDLSDINKFSADLPERLPPAANITSLSITTEPVENIKTFTIKESLDLNDDISEISPDIAVCNECLEDIKSQHHRFNYPFINCTNCGPRFTIIQDYPYDRRTTTMETFSMCGTCEKEYIDIHDRRFHAQPVACSTCGPQYELIQNSVSVSRIQEIILRVSQLTEEGKIIAIKGLGGFFLMCDALNNSASKKLRDSKIREGKPFAVMFKDLNTIEQYAFVNEQEKKSLISWRRPIVILEKKKELAPEVGKNFNTIGAFLPYMPIHYLLFEKLKTTAIVLTSGNISDEPIIIDNHKAQAALSPISDALLIYNRDIYNRTDDSVVKIINNKEQVFRRSRGYVPEVFELQINADSILATGAELVNCFCLGKGNTAILSQHIGDLKNYETYEFYLESIERFKKLFRIKPTLIAADSHPDYLSVRYARELSLPIVFVQHHYAHIVSCMVENQLNTPVIGVSFDGTGYGDDGNIWGSEFLICDLKEYKRVAHFEYIPLPGGDKATEEPWRTAVSYLYKIFGKELTYSDLPFLKKIDSNTVSLVIQSIEKNINCPLSCSAGRLFDAVAALLNICPVSDFHAQAPMLLESVLQKNVTDFYRIHQDDTLSFLPVIQHILDDMKNLVPVSVISAKFHNTVAEAIKKTVLSIRETSGLNQIALSGGTFQNKYLTECVVQKLENLNFKVYTQHLVPCNDGGIALGQLAVAAEKRKNSRLNELQEG